MKLKEKLNVFIFVMLYFSINYLLCSTHEMPNTTGYVSRRKRFCSTPFYVFIIISLIVILFYN